MSNRPPKGNQADAIARFSPFVQVSFDLARQDMLATAYGVDFIHYKHMPSPIGKNDRGDLRRSDGVDTITSNGMLYTCAGQFTASINGNTSKRNATDGGQNEAAEARLILPRFYNVEGDVNNGKRIYLLPGDRLYIADKNADVKTVAAHEMDYEVGIDNVPIYPICEMDGPIVDSQGIQYQETIDFVITDKGNIRWVAGGKNPGVDLTTGKGRIYSIRYLYKGYWYVTSLPKEIRISNVTTNGVRAPERMSYSAVIQREYLFHNQNKADALNQNVPKTPDRVQKAPTPPVVPNAFSVPVDMSAIEDDGNQEQSSD